MAHSPIVFVCSFGFGFVFIYTDIPVEIAERCLQFTLNLSIDYKNK